MSQEARKKAGSERDIDRIPSTTGHQKSYEGFEGMNYEQVRQPFNPKNAPRLRLTDNRTEFKNTPEK